MFYSLLLQGFCYRPCGWKDALLSDRPARNWTCSYQTKWHRNRREYRATFHTACGSSRLQGTHFQQYTKSSGASQPPAHRASALPFSRSSAPVRITVTYASGTIRPTLSAEQASSLRAKSLTATRIDFLGRTDASSLSRTDEAVPMRHALGESD